VSFLLRTSAAAKEETRSCIQVLIEEIAAAIKMKSIMYGKNYPQTWVPKFVDKQGAESSIEKTQIKLLNHPVMGYHVKIKKADGSQTITFQDDFKNGAFTLTDLRVFLYQIGSHDQFSRQFKSNVDMALIIEEKRLLDAYLDKNKDCKKIYR